MELLEKETFYYRFNNQLIEPVRCAFFEVEQYRGYMSHQEAVLAFLTYVNRSWAIQVPRFVPGLKQKLDQVPKVEVTLTPEIETRIEAGVNAQIETDMKQKVKSLKARGKNVDYVKLQKYFEQFKQELIQDRKETRKMREVASIRFPKLYELTANVKLVYTKDTDFDSYKGFPIRVNPTMMQGTEISPENFFLEDGEYERAFRSYLQVHRTKEDFQRVNQLLFPQKEELIIYQWNNDFTSYYNEERNEEGAYLWTIYDQKKKLFTVMDIILFIP